jgi:hypothetical protein
MLVYLTGAETAIKQKTNLPDCFDGAFGIFSITIGTSSGLDEFLCLIVTENPNAYTCCGRQFTDTHFSILSQKVYNPNASVMVKYLDEQASAS